MPGLTHNGPTPTHPLAWQLFKYEDRYILNPGSATGAFSTTSASTRPSFVLMNVEDGGSAKLFVYEIDDAGELKISEVQLVKKEPSSS